MSNNNDLAPVPAWLQSIRDAIMRSVKPADIEGIIEKQIELALDGDRAAAKFVLDYTIGQPQPGVTLIQNNLHIERPQKKKRTQPRMLEHEPIETPEAAPPLPNEPTSHRPGSAERLAELRRRAAEGRSLTHPNDTSLKGDDYAGD